MTVDDPRTSEALRGAFLDAMSRVAATVTVVTTDGTAGTAGSTVSSMTSVSADGPNPCVLICLHGDGNLGRTILRNRGFCVNVLTVDQAWISDMFAGRGGHDQPGRFNAVDWSPMANGSPGLANASIRLSCEVLSSQRVGTHDVIFGAVTQISAAERSALLVYANRAYARLEALTEMKEPRDGTKHPEYSGAAIGKSGVRRAA